ncbi:hypothetical protein I4U23_007890 [Adineta vaga]|nr:hypothetical protein I4U23_007890 [Adineta vaga]
MFFNNVPVHFTMKCIASSRVPMIQMDRHHSQTSLLNDDENDNEGGEDEEEDMDNFEQENENEISSPDDKITQAIHRLIEYQKQTEARWYKYLEQQANLELQRRQDDRAYQLQLIQLLTNVISTNLNSSTFSQQPMVHNNDSLIEKVLPDQEEHVNRGEKRKCSPKTSMNDKKAKLRQTLPSNFYSLLAQIHNINTVHDDA